MINDLNMYESYSMISMTALCWTLRHEQGDPDEWILKGTVWNDLDMRFLCTV